MERVNRIEFPVDLASPAALTASRAGLPRGASIPLARPVSGRRRARLTGVTALWRGAAEIPSLA